LEWKNIVEMEKIASHWLKQGIWLNQ